MTAIVPAEREVLNASPAAVIAALPAMGKLMITAKHLGATHERIGTIEAVAADDEGWLVCSGTEHHSRIDPTAIAEIIVDRTSVMGGQSYPRIDFRTAEGVVLFSVVGFAGAEPFEAALADFGVGTPLPLAEKPVPGERGAVSDIDPGAIPLKAAMATAQPVSIRFDRPGFHQRWDGVIETVKPAMGFSNVMRADFHLHLKADAVARWQPLPADGRLDLVALDANDAPLGLSLHGPVAAFTGWAGA